MNKNIIVFGGAGYIGSHACKALKLAGYNPIVFDNLATGHEWAIQWGDFFKGDINNINNIEEAFKKYEPIAVMHFAAASLVGESVNEPLKYYQNNVSGTINILHMMKKYNVKYIVFSSTAAVYGEPEVTPIKEDLPQMPINPYGRSKLMIEHILDDVQKAHGIQSVRFRYFNAAGADLDGTIGEAHEPETHLIPRVLMAAAKDEDHIKLFGTDYPTEDGTAVRDYIHVTDLIDAHILGLQYLENGGDTTVFNLGTSHGFSVAEIINATKRATNHEIKVVETPRRAGDPAILIADNKKAKDILGWELKHSDIDTVLRSAWAWYQKWRVFEK
ncbi:MAG: UDP-glucose 4-epimerase GalE [Alphaproteobacteria bacterium]